MTKLNQNTTSLQEILAAVNNLPDAGGGGGGASAEPCYGAYAGMNAPCHFYVYQDIEGNLHSETFTDEAGYGLEFENVAKDSYMYLVVRSIHGGTPTIVAMTNADIISITPHLTNNNYFTYTVVVKISGDEFLLR